MQTLFLYLFCRSGLRRSAISSCCRGIVVPLSPPVDGGVVPRYLLLSKVALWFRYLLLLMVESCFRCLLLLMVAWCFRYPSCRWWSRTSTISSYRRWGRCSAISSCRRWGRCSTVSWIVCSGILCWWCIARFVIDRLVIDGWCPYIIGVGEVVLICLIFFSGRSLNDLLFFLRLLFLFSLFFGIFDSSPLMMTSL